LKNDIISSVRKRYCALGLGLELGLANFGQTRFRASVVDPCNSPCNYSVFILFLLNQVESRPNEVGIKCRAQKQTSKLLE